MHSIPLFDMKFHKFYIIILNSIYWNFFLTGEELEVKRLSIRGLLPDTDYYMTYDGSTTMPACHETVTWLILNKPIYITKQQVSFLFFYLKVSSKTSFTLTLDNSRSSLFVKEDS